MQDLKHKCTHNLSIKVGETIIGNVNSAKLLGVVIDRFHSWSTHTEALTKKTCQVKLEFYEESDLFCLTKRHSKFLTLLFSPILITVVQIGLT